MVSRRNFFSIFLMMAVLLFMFQFSQVIKENESDYAVNIYLGDGKLSGGDRWRQTGPGPGESYASGDFVLYFGEKGSSLEGVVSLWCEYTKRNLVYGDSLADYEIREKCLPEAVLLDCRSMDVHEGLRVLDSLTEYGVTLIFCNLPEPAVLRLSAGLRRLLGIHEVVADRVETEGVHLFSGFFLGGESIYVAGEDEEDRQDLELSMPWYVTSGGTKTYMVGMLEERLKEDEAKNERFPGLIWRNSYGDSKVFAVNGDYMDGAMGIGILDSMMYEAGSYAIYPVVNAQNVMLVDFPGFAEENGARMTALYSRGTESVLRDLCWPSLSGTAERGHYRMTCLLAAQYDYSDGVEPSAALVPFYLQQLREFSMEAGLSLECRDGTALSYKLERDGEFYASLEDQYTYSAVYAGSGTLEMLEELLYSRELLQNVCTVAGDFRPGEPVVSYYNDDVTLQNTTADAKAYSYGDDLRVKSLETALGYSNVQLDMYHVVWPKGVEDQWENMSEEVTSNLNTYWKPFAAFDKTTLSESDDRVRNFLNLDYEDRREEGCIYLELSGAEEGWFLLRTHGESISYASGAEYREVETDAYLIHALQANVEIRLQKNRGLLEYDMED